MANKNYKLTIVDGQVKVINTKGNVVDVIVEEGVEVRMKTAQEVKETAEVGIQVSAEVAPVDDKHGHTEIPDFMFGKYGVCHHKNLYYMVCTHCGSYVSMRQAQYSVNHWGRVICIDCQRHERAHGEYFTSPEERFTKEVKFSRECDNPKCVDKKELALSGKVQRRKITGSHLNLSLKLTDGQYGLCPHCLVKYALAKGPVAPVQAEVKPEVVPAALQGEDAVPEF